MAKSNLLKEAIADAKAVRETAIANAKLALEEAFTPKLQSMLSRKIEEELEDEEDTVEEQSTSSGIGTGTGVKVADGKDEEKAETKTSSASAGTEGDDTVVDKLTENEDEEELEETYEGEEEEEVTENEDEEVAAEESELDAELEEIIKELEAEDDEVATEDEEETMEGSYSEEEEMETPVAEDEDEEVAAEEEEIDLEEIIKSLREDDDDEDDDDDDDETMDEAEAHDDEEPSKELEEAYATIRSLKGTINEVNLLNAKLLFSNKLFRSHNLTEGQKMRVIETFDRATNVREVKLVFSTLAESLSTGATKKSSLREGFASKVSKSTKPSKAVIVEANQFNSRMKKLAGLL